MTKTREQTAQELADWNFEIEPDQTKIYWLTPGSEQEGAPIQLLEVSGSASPSLSGSLNPGRVTAFEFGPGQDIPYHSVVAEITASELVRVKAGLLEPPDGWSLKNLKSAKQFGRPRVPRSRRNQLSPGG